MGNTTNYILIKLISSPRHSGQLYWSHGKHDTNTYLIENSRLDGTGRTVLVNCTELANSLAMDFATNRLYFVYNRSIAFVDLVTRHVFVVLSTDTGELTGVTVYKDRIYYGDASDNTIRHCEKTACSASIVLRNNSRSDASAAAAPIVNLRMYHPDAQRGTNPCAPHAHNGGCQHLCFGLSATAYVCKCSIGYYVDPQNSSRCLGEDEFLLYSVGHELKGLRQYDPAASESGEVARVLGPLSRISLASVIDYHARNDQLFWADNERGTITRIRRDGTDRRVIVKLDPARYEKVPVPKVATPTTASYASAAVTADSEASDSEAYAGASGPADISLDGLAVDWVAGNIYWSVARRNVIEVSRLDGSHPHAVIWSNVQSPRALAVDPVAGYLFYAADGRIGRIGLDGSQPFVLANRTAQVTSLVVDIDAQVVYWCEAAGSGTEAVIMRVDYDGNSKTIMLNHSLVYPVAVAVQNGTLYWADNDGSDSGSILAAPATNASAFTVLVRNEGSALRDLRVFSNQLQKGTNACAVRNGGCHHLCLFNGTHAICACSYARLADDGRACRPYEEFLLYSNIRSIESLHLMDRDAGSGDGASTTATATATAAGNPSGQRSMRLDKPVQSIRNETVLRNAIALGYDFAAKLVFYSDIASHSINSVPFDGNASAHRVLVGKQIAVEGLCYEPITRALFWTSNRNASVRSVAIAALGADATANAAAVVTVVRLGALDKPRGLAVESCLGMVYWTNWNTQAAAIQRAFLTGYGVETIIRKDIRMPNAITLDVEQNKLYWADARLDKIERANYDGSARVVLFHSTAKHPFAIAVYGDLLFWTDWVLGAVMRANKYSGTDVVYLRRGVEKAMGIVAVQNTTRDCAANGCRVLNGGCEDVCTVLPASGAVRCECSQGVLAQDGRRCVRNTGKEMLVDGGEVCGASDFRCKSGQCVPLQLTCDHIAHCADATDEAEGYCNWRKCPPEWFECANHRCIPAANTCDGVQHCGDGSDEAMCECRAPEHFRCRGGQCVAASSRCDGQQDCPDSSDEVGCAVAVPVQCPRGQVQCEGRTQCYAKAGRCDGRADCADGSDERDCAESTCADSEFV